jgi:hypothetical protein
LLRKPPLPRSTGERKRVGEFRTLPLPHGIGGEVASLRGETEWGYS